MKKAIVLAIIATLGCTTFVSAQDGTKTATSIPAGKERISLEAIEIPATMIVPAGVKALEETYSYYISNGSNFIISVESAYDMTLEKAKAEIASNPDKKLLSTKAHSVIFKETMMGREMVHFETYIEIGGQLYRFYDKRVTPLTLDKITPMCEAAETIQPL